MAGRRPCLKPFLHVGIQLGVNGVQGGGQQHPVGEGPFLPHEILKHATCHPTPTPSHALFSWPLSLHLTSSVFSYSSSSSRGKCHVLREAFPDHSSPTACPLLRCPYQTVITQPFAQVHVHSVSLQSFLRGETEALLLPAVSPGQVCCVVTRLLHTVTWGLGNVHISEHALKQRSIEEQGHEKKLLQETGASEPRGKTQGSQRYSPRPRHIAGG